MQIYMPYASVQLNAAVLDEMTLDHQLNQSLAILETLQGKAKGWQWHPGVTMWEGHEDFLAEHAFAAIRVWTKPPFSHPDLWTSPLAALGFRRGLKVAKQPWWWGHQMFHMANQSVLLRIKPDWYATFFKVPNDICEWWPLADEGKFKYGPQPQPGGGFDYIVEGRPIYKPARSMTALDFAQHANVFHNLQPDLKSGVSAHIPDEMRQILVTLHDRFHTLRVYKTHDHS